MSNLLVHVCRGFIDICTGARKIFSAVKRGVQTTTSYYNNNNDIENNNHNDAINQIDRRQWLIEMLKVVYNIATGMTLVYRGVHELIQAYNMA